MKLHELVAAPRKHGKRVGRGISAGRGKTAGRGTKGQKSRSGHNIPKRFEGGQSPFIQRLPKHRGFTSMYAKPATVRIDRLMARLSGTKITAKALVEAGLITAQEAQAGLIKIVGDAKELKAFTWAKNIRFSKALAAKMPHKAKSEKPQSPDKPKKQAK